MAKKSAIQKNLKRKLMSQRDAKKRAELKAIVRNLSLPAEERFTAQLKLSAMPRNGAKVRIRNRCALSGRPRGVYRKFELSRVALRELASTGYIPGMVKSSW
ncbi:MAG: 30S ribosomal protein S14 [Rhodospirillaceae bacterium]|nr:30S ribosomal protein S14 [Rhodospirillaceae bacterium]|tara:strand:+ start:2391 stop:2696 length:306 start_codon:yes stop_codon:yes gene_type:complete